MNIVDDGMIKLERHSLEDGVSVVGGIEILKSRESLAISVLLIGRTHEVHHGYLL